MPPLRATLIWGALVIAVAAPVVVAATSPLLEWRDPIYIAAGFAGVAAMALILVQPLLAGGYLPGLPARIGRRVHLWTGLALLSAITIHVVGLWITSPPDVIDALLFVSPTPFSVWGVVAMWALLAAATLMLARRRFRISPRIWRPGHTGLVALVVLGSVVHAMLIEGTMGPLSKAALCLLTLAALAKTAFDLRSWALLGRRNAPRDEPS